MAKFIKGQSGNPGGRPKDDNELKRLCKEATKESYGRISDIAQHSEDDGVRLKANTWILEYGWGKAKEQVELTGEDGGPAILQVLTKVEK